MSRVKTFDSTGISPGGFLFAGDLNNIQDHFADLTNLGQNFSVGSIAVGEAGLTITRFASGILRVSGQIRSDSVVNAVTGFQVNGSPMASTHLADSATIARTNGAAFSVSPTAPTPSPGDNSSKVATTAFVAAAVAAAGGGASPIPTGVIMAYAGVTAPAGYLMCDGAAVSRTTYAALFSIISTNHGSGDGTTTFNVPDMRGRVPVGKNAATFSNLGDSGGEEAHTMIVGEMPSHNHTAVAISAGTPSGTISSVSAGTPAGSVSSAGAHTHPITAFEQPGTISEPGLATIGGTSTPNALVAQSAGAHTHPFVGSPLAAHTHTFAGAVLPTHNHTINNTGGGAAHNNLQPYLVTNYIIKI